MGWFGDITNAIAEAKKLTSVEPDATVEVETLDPEPAPVVSKWAIPTNAIPDKVPLNAGLFTNDRNVYSPDGVIVGTAKTGTGGNWGSTYTRPVREISDASLDSEESRNIAKLTVNYTAEQIQAIKGLSNAPATSQFLCGDL